MPPTPTPRPPCTVRLTGSSRTRSTPSPKARNAAANWLLLITDPAVGARDLQQHRQHTASTPSADILTFTARAAPRSRHAAEVPAVRCREETIMIDTRPISGPAD